MVLFLLKVMGQHLRSFLTLDSPRQKAALWYLQSWEARDMAVAASVRGAPIQTVEGLIRLAGELRREGALKLSTDEPPHCQMRLLMRDMAEVRYWEQEMRREMRRKTLQHQ